MAHPPEDELADTVPKQPLALTLGAAAVTLVVIIGVLAGPSVVYCFNAEDGLGQCLRGQMVQSGLLRQPEVAAVDPARMSQPPAAPATAEPETGIADPALDVTPPANQETDSVVAATFGLLRAEPDGSVVIAGSGTPGSEVEVFANDDLLGTAMVEPSGDWVFVPATPLKPGELEITLGEAGKPGRAAESIVVAINEDRTSQPLVVASKPGAPSEILQGPQEDAQIASAEPAPEPLTPPAEPPPAAEPVPPQEPDASNTMASADAENIVAAPEIPAPAAPADAPEAVAPPASDLAALPENAPATTPPQALPDADAAQPAEPAVASADPAPATPAPATPTLDSTPPTIDAVEIEGDRTFFAGAGPEGANIRLYVDDQFIADTEVSGGRWLVEAGPVLNQPSQRVRIDMLQPGTADVAARAEVNFVLELPAEDPVAVAQADTPAPVPVPAPPAEAQASPAVEPEPAPPTSAAPAPQPAEAPPSAPIQPRPAQPGAPAAQPSPPAEQTAPAPSPATPQPAVPQPGARVPQPAEPAVTPSAPAATEQPVPTPPSPPQAPPAVEPAPASSPRPTEQPVATPLSPPQAPAAVEPTPTSPSEPVVAASTPPTAEPSTAPQVPEATAPSEPAPEPTPADSPASAEPEIPTMVAVAVGGPDAERFAAGKAIIRRGDNLWTIARRVYGQGVKYTTIYEANTGQIRDPDRIYPGQVFALPENTAN